MSFKKYPAELLQKIKEAINIIDVIGEHVVLRKAGANYTGLCPFHSERSPSFSVSENKQLYHCYGCKKGGDLVSFVMEINGIDFPEAIEDLADRARVALPKAPGEKSSDDPEVQARRTAAREKLGLAQKLNRFVAAYYHHILSTLPGPESYFRKRGIPPESDLAKSFYLGAAPEGWDGLSKHLQEKKAPLDLAVELGLIRPSPKGPAKPGGVGYFDMLRNRAIFPIIDTRGKVVGFGGRKLSEDEEGPKYLNSSDSILFQKGKLAYGLYQAQKFIRERDEIIIVEGYFDVLALHAAGFQNGVATCGTALTEDHLYLFKKFASKITLLFDGDRAGISATDRAMELGLENGFILYGAAMPEGLDPDEVLFEKDGLPKSGGKEQMDAILKSAHPLLDHRIEEAARYAEKGAEERTLALKKVASWLSHYSDAVGREIRIESVLKLFRIQRSLLDQAMRGGNAGGVAKAARPVAPATPASPKTQRKLTSQETMLLMGWAKGGTFAKILNENRAKLPSGWGVADLFEHTQLQGLIRDREENPDAIFPEDLDSQVRSVLTEALVSDKLPFDAKDFQMAVERGVARSWARFSQQIKKALSAAESKKDAELQAKLMQEYLDVQRKMKEFTSFYDEA